MLKLVSIERVTPSVSYEDHKCDHGRTVLSAGVRGCSVRADNVLVARWSKLSCAGADLSTKLSVRRTYWGRARVLSQRARWLTSHVYSSPLELS